MRAAAIQLTMNSMHADSLEQNDNEDEGDHDIIFNHVFKHVSKLSMRSICPGETLPPPIRT
jgi:hypothetical protein